MKFNLFNTIKIDININSNNNIRKKFKDIIYSHFNKRYFIFSMIIILSFLIIQIKNLRNEYEINQIAQYDIVSSKTITYNVNLLDEKIKDEIIQSTTPEYDKIDEIKEQEVLNFNNFLVSIQKLDENNDDEIKKIIQENKLNITSDELKVIIKRKDFQYYVTLVDYLDKIYNVGIYNISEYKKVISNLSIILDKAEEKLILNFIKPNLVLNKEKTQARINENIEKIKNTKKTIKAGEIIVKKGDKITQNNIEELQAAGMILKKDKIMYISGSLLFYSIFLIILYLPVKKFFEKEFESKSYIPTMLTLILVNLIYIISYYKTNISTYITPFYILPILSVIINKNKLYTFMLTTLNYIILLENTKWLVILIPIYVYMIYKNSNIRSRNQIVKNFIELSLYQIILVIPYSIIIQNGLNELLKIIILTIITGFLSGIITIGLLPYFENSFKILTDIKLLELADFSNPLLKKLLVIAPGTFHHSLMVGALSERAAELIGINPIFVRVASYYHDIGKMKRPKYFIENQFEHINPHDKLSPEYSAEIIISHVSDGVVLATQNDLPDEIIDIIKQHHGTTLVKYFYYKSLENNGSQDINKFMYLGPKPQTKESAIIMLADSIEAAVRVQKDKSPESIEELVRYLINSKIEEMQLSECELTYREIEKIIRGFLEVLQGAYHERIEYPKIQKEEKE